MLLFFPKEVSFSLTNSHHHPILDYFFTIITYFGDGLFIIACGLYLFFFKSKKLGAAIILTYIGSGILCSVLKNLICNPRPAFSLIDKPDFHTVPWLSTAYYKAFPSGHTTSAFAFATCLSLFCENKKIGYYCTLIACLTAYSRIYLGQHYWEDVWFGSLLGVLFSSIFYFVIVHCYSKIWDKKIPTFISKLINP
ncbi:phosphatase PAP2 family protein [Sphingobacterium sp. HJSM2_6]|uniref:phosphatase PAP2 family protein n=1 Tax=Sphingobacterium sp. HJSM2_6 TaxID=3366264 RepID=UPI003BCA0103